ncbi:MAG TPA: anthranilate synthase component I family protein, partial [Pyrinomonadaceae bacterium]|nr:anthranilate synthase component I family protein [Pyrinomonadaceae bacterium]
IRGGDTYQTNLTQQLRCELPSAMTPETVFWRLRRDHPAPFSAYLRRRSSTVVSASPERFFRTTRSNDIESSPIKGTRPRGRTRDADLRLRSELLSSAKDRAENTMIVDLVRNDLGRVCKYGSVAVEKLCDIEEHPTLFHLVSTVRGDLRDGVKLSEILRAVFPCGSITGAPKIRTMQIIDRTEDSARGLSMGAIGLYLPESWDFGNALVDTVLDLSVAIRTMVIRDGEAVFNVGGGVVIDSVPEKEFEESLLKAQSLLNAIGASYPESDD